jgi:DNA-binding beta-propeller fold protein YncE
MKACIENGKFGRMLALGAVAVATLLALFLAAATPGVAAVHAANPGPHEWLLAAVNDGALSVVDTSMDVVYGPFLSGELGSAGGGLFDVAVTPDGKTALVSNFGDSTIYFVDMSNPISPSVITSVTLSMFAEDIAIDPHGEFALVTDGGFSYVIDVIDLISRTLAYSVTLPSYGAQAVDIADDGTVVTVDYFASVVQSLYPDASGHLTVTGIYTFALPSASLSTASMGAALLSEESEPAWQTRDENDRQVQAVSAEELFYPRPVNVAIAPDGQTVIVPGVSAYGTPTDTLYALGVYKILEPGVLTFTQALIGLPRAAQSVAFSTDGKKAYLSGNGAVMEEYDYNRLMVLDILGPGQAQLASDNAADFPRLTSSQLFGVDTIAVASGKAYVGYPTLSGARNDLRVVNLSDYGVRSLTMPGIVAGVAAIPTNRVYLPLIVRNDM